jgi:hypothetical protein
LSHSNPSTHCCDAKNNGVAASANCRGSVTLTKETIPMLPVNPAVTKLAVAEKHIAD